MLKPIVNTHTHTHTQWTDRPLGQMVKAKLYRQNHTKKHTHTHSQKEKKEQNVYIYKKRTNVPMIINSI